MLTIVIFHHNCIDRASRPSLRYSAVIIVFQLAMSIRAPTEPATAGFPTAEGTARAAVSDANSHRRPLRVLVLAADPRTAAGIRQRLERLPAVDIVGSVPNADAAVARCARSRIDVVVAVPTAASASARELQRTAAIRAKFPATRVVLAVGSHDRLWPSVVARPDGLLAAAAPTPEVGAVVGTAAAGHLTIGRSLREAFFDACAPAAAETPLDDLTPRELQILARGARGLTSREIAAELHLAVNTVDKALTVTYRKLRARNRTEACLIAARRGLLR